MIALKCDGIIKNHVTYVTILVFFERSYLFPHSYIDSFIHSPLPGYLMLKKSRVVRINQKKKNK